LQDVLNELKSVLDPQGILAPGKYGIGTRTATAGGTAQGVRDAANGRAYSPPPALPKKSRSG
jgi:hypothetical protein